MLDTQVAHEDVQLQKVVAGTHGEERLSSQSVVITSTRMRVPICFCVQDNLFLYTGYGSMFDIQ